MTAGVSLEYKKKERFIATRPNITLDDWRKAGLWCKNKQCEHIYCDEEAIYFVPSSKGIDEQWTLSADNVQRLKIANFKTFDQLIDFGKGLHWSVKLFNDKNDWSVHSSCDCPYFLKNYKCKHVIGMALRQRIAKIPMAAVSTQIGAKPKRGRKKKAAQALLTQ